MSDRTVVEAQLRADMPTLTVREGGQDRKLSQAEYDAAIGFMADNAVTTNTAAATERADHLAAVAIVARLRNGTATNDDRNKAILFLLRRIRPDL